MKDFIYDIEEAYDNVGIYNIRGGFVVMAADDDEEYTATLNDLETAYRIKDRIQMNTEPFVV